MAAHRDALRAAYYEGRIAGRLNPTDVGSHKLLGGQGWKTYAPRSMLMTNGLSSMGFSLPAAIAAKLVHPIPAGRS